MNIEQAAFIASIVSGILAILAIILSIIFYRMADGIAQRTKDISVNISSAVERLEVFFKTFYADIFGIMKDTYIGMRDHVFVKDTRFSSSLIEERTEEKLKNLKADMKKELGAIISRIDTADTKVDQVRNLLESMIDRAVDESANAERLTYEEVIIKDALEILDILLENHKDELPAVEFIRPFAARYGHQVAFQVLKKLKEQGLLEFGQTEDTDIYRCSIRYNRDALRWELHKYKERSH